MERGGGAGNAKEGGKGGGTVKWLNTVLLTHLLLGGGISEAIWQARVAALLEQEGIAESALRHAPGFDLRLTVEGGEVSGRLGTGITGGRTGRAYTLQGLCLFSRSRGVPRYERISIAGQFEFGRGRLGFGPARGGLGAGLVCDFTWRLRTGAQARGAWTGLPHGLRTAAGVAPEPTQLLTWQRRDGRGLAWAVAFQPDRSTTLLAGWTIGSGLRTMVLLAADRRAVEFTAGWRQGGDGIEGRFSGALWETPQAGKGERRGGAVEGVVSRRRDGAAWEIRFWTWSGSRPPLAPLVNSATRSRRRGLRAGLELRPPFGVKLAVSSEIAGGIGTPGERCGWWRSEGRIAGGGKEGAVWNLTLRRTREREPQLWIPALNSTATVTDLRLQSRPQADRRWRVGIRQVRGETGARSRGAWVQRDFILGGGNGYLRGSYALPGPRAPLYWYEPAPFPGRNLRRVTAAGPAIILGWTDRTGRVGVRFRFDESGAGEFLLRFHRYR